MTKFLSQIFLLFFLGVRLGFTGEVSNFRIIQATTQGQQITAYLDVRDSKDKALEIINPSQFNVTVGEHHVEQLETGLGIHNIEGTAYIFLIDISKSLTDSKFTELKNAVKEWISSLETSDSIALISIGTNVETVQAFTKDFQKANEIIDKIRRTDNFTRLYDGLNKALNMGPAHRIDSRIPKRRIIITLSDGINDVQNDGGATREEVVASIKKNRLPVYAIGFPGTSVNRQKEAGLRNLEELARVSSGFFVKAKSAGDLKAAYVALQKQISEIFYVRFECDNCAQDNQNTRLEIKFSENRRTLKDNITIRLPPIENEVITQTPACETLWCRTTRSLKNPWILSFLGILILLVVGLLFWFWRRRARGMHTRIDNDFSISLQSPTENNRGKNNIHKLMFTVVSGQENGKIYQLDFENNVILGRSPESDLAIVDDLKISKQHCKIEHNEGKFLISDLKSKHGTFLNGVTLFGQRILEKGDLISIGQTQMRFEADG